MAAISQIAQPLTPPQLRPLNPRHDLPQVADLIELCFADTLDGDGKLYLRRMRQGVENRRNAWFETVWFPAEATTAGFVWDENGQVAGNISLIPFFNLGRPIYLIANVAVHPDFRRRGIARALTQKALTWAAKQRVRLIWLQVRRENEAALKLYQSLGFIERACRTTWVRLPEAHRGQAPSGVRLTPRKPGHWPQQRKWLRQNYPDELLWYWPIRPVAFRPGFLGAIANFFNETELRHWSAERQGTLLGTLSWRATPMYADQLWLAAPPESEDAALQTLLPNIHWRERDRRPLSLDYPAGRAANTLAEAGFRPDHTLIWMEKSG